MSEQADVHRRIDDEDRRAIEAKLLGDVCRLLDSGVDFRTFHVCLQPSDVQPYALREPKNIFITDVARLHQRRVELQVFSLP